jgi:hypothetical protein
MVTMEGTVAPGMIGTQIYTTAKVSEPILILETSGALS